MIHYVQRQDIDSEKWNGCIDRSVNSLVYAYSFYLDVMSDHWDALILGDYEYVMPLTWRRKFGFRYLYPPPFTQQGGVFSEKIITPQIVDAFLRAATEHFRYVDIYLNHACALGTLHSHCNLLLSLSPGYEQLRDAYKKDLNNNLRLASRHPLVFLPTADYNTVLKLFRHRYASQIRTISDDGYNRFAKLITHHSDRFYHLVRTVNGNSEELLAAALLLVCGRRMYLLQSYVSDSGRIMKANHFLIDRLIHEFSEGGFILDFEGSDIPGIASFYRGFGATDQPYFFYHHHRLPALAATAKKVYDKLLKDFLK